jgi:hypothetical protein
MAVVLVAVNVWTVASAMVAVAAVEPPAEVASVQLQPPDPDDLPDVYYIILDRYAGPTALRQTYDFDNEPFLAQLESRGFAVARHAHANYIKTPLSLGSSLNIDFLDADRTFHYEGQDEFSTVLAQTTFLRAFNEPEAAPTDPWDWRVLRRHTLYELEKLEEIPSLPGPKYVFAHLLIPHDPYVFNADGTFTGRAQVAQLGDLESYRRQLEYANRRILGIIDRIVASDPGAVIMLQGDEGPFPERYQADEWGFEWREATTEELEQKFNILFAMRVPDTDVAAAGFHDDITPVNAFRVIFNARFGADLPLLPDRTWAHQDLDHFYDFFEITDRLDHGSPSG